MTDLTDLQKKANEILSSMDRERESGRSVYKRSNNWASDLMHPCIRYLTYSRLNWEDKKLIDINGLYRIEEGSNVERNLSREFTDLGFELELVQQYFSWDKYQIAGKIDGKIRVNGDRFPVEIKSGSTAAGDMFRGLINSLEIELTSHAKSPLALLNPRFAGSALAEFSRASPSFRKRG